jgi:hypothetical protein
VEVDELFTFVGKKTKEPHRDWHVSREQADSGVLCDAGEKLDSHAAVRGQATCC